MPRPLITENDVRRAARNGKRELYSPPNAIITPLARDVAQTLGLRFVSSKNESAALPPNDLITIAIGSDHSGFCAKAELKTFLADKGYRLLDVGTDSEQSCDYPDFAEKVGEAIRTGRATFGIMLDGVGTASAVALNKIPSIRAASCYNEFTARIARAHGDANALSLGARSLGIETMKSIVQTFLATSFEGERHEARLEKIRAIERRYLQR
ncbi:MAG: ribose 5-phosphate isomerase B [Chloroherpetonaceae bacterium]|nr:ribose 5-phosphate isomerase B [Chloroherpetonaceae bacterium]MDW8436956.1 ribose 5-phosphate isomerase B [Chloroherpetonaceae bacterium]